MPLKLYNTIRMILLIRFKNTADYRNWSCAKKYEFYSEKPTREFLKTHFFQLVEIELSLQHSIYIFERLNPEFGQMDLTICFKHIIILFDGSDSMCL